MKLDSNFNFLLLLRKRLVALSPLFPSPAAELNSKKARVAGEGEREKEEEVGKGELF